MERNLLLVWVVGVVTGLLGACCPCPGEDRRPVPPPVPRMQQMLILNARADMIPAFKARGTVKLEWTDEQGFHSHTADGVLLARHLDGRNQGQRDALVIGSVAGQDVFEVGANEQWEWMAFRTDPKTAVVAPADDAAEFHVRFRAARVLDLLALTPLVSEHVVYTIDEQPARSTLYVLNPWPGPPDARPVPLALKPRTIERMVILDRRAPAGQVAEVRVYLPSGLVEAVAQLSEYGPVLSAEGEALSAEVQLPRRIAIDYPAQKAHIELRLESVMLTNPANAVPYRLPDFKGQGFEEGNIIQARPTGSP